MIFTRSEVQTVPTRVPPTLEGTGIERGMPCVLRDTRVAVGVSGFIAEVRVEQTYVNVHARPLNTLYTFPLPGDAAVCAFEFTVAGKVVHGVVRERGAARAEFAQAREAGRHAGLMEQERPNVFTLELANVPAGATVKAVVTYLEALPYRSGAFELRFPTVAAPRYTPGEAEPAANHAPGGTTGHTFAIDIDVDAGMPIEGWTCATHALTAAPAGPNQLALRLAGTDRADRDLVLAYRVGGAGIRLGMVTYRPDPAQDGSFYLFAVPPADVASADVRGKELVFLLDRSGSMAGPKMSQACGALKGCLRALNPADAFAIYAFDNTCEGFAAAPVPFAQAQLEAAERWLAQVQARGGTDLLPALTQVLALPADPARQRVVVVITDGQVGNEPQILAHLRQHGGGARVFTVGVDTAVNGWFLKKLATLGRGAAELVLPTGDIEGAIAGLAQRFGSPLLTDPVADFGLVRVSDLTPHPLPDVMAGQVVVVAGRYRGHGQTEVSFAGQGPGRLLEHRVEVTFPREDRAHPTVEKIWARLMIDRHEDALIDDPNASTVKAKIVALAVQHGLLSSQTSFLAVDERDGDPKKAREAIAHTVPLEMPAGWEMAAGGVTLAGGMRAPAPQHSYATKALTEPAQSPLFCLSADTDDDDRGATFMQSRPAARTVSARTVSARTVPAAHEPVDALRELAKQQRADGSWNGSVDDTAAALLLLVQAGHTDRTGAYTAQIRRAIEFLDRALDAGWKGDHAKLLAAITALATATGSAQHRALQSRIHVS